MAYLAIFVLTFLDLAPLFQTAALPRPNESVEHDGKVYITGHHNHVVISNYGNIDGDAVAEIHKKLNSLIKKDLELSNKIQELDLRILMLKQTEKRFSSMNKTMIELNNKIHNATLSKRGYALLFPRKGTTDYVITRGMPSLTEITACFWMKSADTGNQGTLLSYSVAGEDNEFLLIDYRKFGIWVADESRATSVSANDGNWHHICATWENTAGSWKLFKDGSIAATGQGLKKGHVIRGGGTLVIGQDQDKEGGSFQDHQNFMGELADVNIWNYALYYEEITRMSQACFIGEGNVFKWADFKLRTRGGVQFITPTCNH